MSSFIERLSKRKEDRGMMANLRCVLVEGKKHRSWPVLHRLGVRVDNKIDAFVAGLFATHPENISSGNFGSTCRVITTLRDQHQGDDTCSVPNREKN